MFRWDMNMILLSFKRLHIATQKATFYPAIDNLLEKAKSWL